MRAENLEPNYGAGGAAHVQISDSGRHAYSRFHAVVRPSFGQSAGVAHLVELVWPAHLGYLEAAAAARTTSSRQGCPDVRLNQGKIPAALCDPRTLFFLSLAGIAARRIQGNVSGLSGPGVLDTAGGPLYPYGRLCAPSCSIHSPVWRRTRLAGKIGELGPRDCKAV